MAVPPSFSIAGQPERSKPMLDWIQNADNTILLLIQNHLHVSFLNGFFIFYTQLGNLGILWIVLSLLLLLRPKTRRAGLLALLSMLVGLLCTNVILKNLVARPRPWLVVEGLAPLMTPPDPNSFPSGHTCAAFASAGAWWRTFPRLRFRLLAVTLAVLMGYSRLYVGLHFPTDVLAGAIVGLFSSFAAWMLYRRGVEKGVRLP